MRGGQVLNNIKIDTTFSKSFVLDQEEFVFVSASGGASGVAVKWQRFPKKENGITDRVSMSARYWDCACFSPKRDIKFLGVGLFGPCHGNDLTFELKWMIEGEDESDPVFFNTADNEYDKESQTYLADIRDLDCSPFTVKSGSKLYIFVKAKGNEDGSYESYRNRQVWYGYGGSRKEYSEFDF